MIEIDEKVYRNLQEQVAKNQEDIQKILQGIATPIPGPQGEQGEQGEQGPKGERGSLIYAGATITPRTYKENDMYIITATNISRNLYKGDVFIYYNNQWVRVCNIRGPQGLQGQDGEVSANPTIPEGTIPTDLNSMEIDGAYYIIPKYTIPLISFTNNDLICPLVQSQGKAYLTFNLTDEKKTILENANADTIKIDLTSITNFPIPYVWIKKNVYQTLQSINLLQYSFDNSGFDFTHALDNTNPYVKMIKIGNGGVLYASALNRLYVAFTNLSDDALWQVINTKASKEYVDESITGFITEDEAQDLIDEALENLDELYTDTIGSKTLVGGTSVEFASFNPTDNYWHLSNIKFDDGAYMNEINFDNSCGLNWNQQEHYLYVDDEGTMELSLSNITYNGEAVCFAPLPESSDLGKYIKYGTTGLMYDDPNAQLTLRPSISSGVSTISFSNLNSITITFGATTGTFTISNAKGRILTILSGSSANYTLKITDGAIYDKSTANGLNHNAGTSTAMSKCAIITNNTANFNFSSQSSAYTITISII